MRRLAVAAAIVLGAGALTACRSDGREMKAPVFPAPVTTTTTTTIAGATGSVAQLDIGTG